ncbi:hypothetical protein A8F94_12205 [Bacillus sp. FJAT-27225]|uniref:hypothetical protein n=1 Tax=Bacillus sp. FJAT-27225 TaxID=1743144 RepID=UPI00080C299E|nr:hypothetical protein [Bacillus sp. FJAT-27225]OCA85636.1 hypothetical protein A8F94_12205 [Bacillus sp. FJAT-27225]
MNFPYYREFYPTAMMQIGANDSAILKDTCFGGTESTHWLIALQEEKIELPEDYCHWKVVVYTADADGAFNWEMPYYTSSLFDTLESAIELAQRYQQCGSNDQLCTMEQNTKIS